MRHPRRLTAALALGVLTQQACDETPTATTAPEALDLDLCAFGQDFTLDPENDFFPLGVGSRWMLEGEEDGATIELRVTVLDETEVVGGVTTRVVEERETEAGEPIEISRNFYAGTEDGTVCYFGEDVDIFENGRIVSHEGAWRADAPGNFPGIIMPANPRTGQTFPIEGAPGVAEDFGDVVAVNAPVDVPAGSFTRTVRIRETNPLEPDFDFKVFARDVGIVVDGPLSLVSFDIVDDP